MDRWRRGRNVFDVFEVELEPGTVGYGEQMVNYTWAKSTEEDIRAAEGQNAQRIMWDSSLGAGLQMALFDAVATHHDVPLYSLFGRKVRDSVSLSWWAIDMPPSDWVTEAELAETAKRFHDLHEERYAYKRPEDPVELVSLRTTLVEDVPTPEYAASFEDARRTSRECYFEATGFTDVPVYNRAAVADEDEVEGPLIVEEPTSTTVVFPDQMVSVDDRANLIITTQP